MNIKTNDSNDAGYKQAAYNASIHTPHVSWSAVIAGLVLSMTIVAALVILGAALGLSIMDFRNGISVKAMSWGSGIWWILAGSVAIFCGSFVAGRLSENVSSFAGVINGLLVWALLSLSSIYVLVGGAVRTTQGAVNSVSAIATGAVSAGGSLNLDGIKALVANDPGLKSALDLLSNDKNQMIQSLEHIDAPELKKAVQVESQNLRERLTQILFQTLKDPNDMRANLESARAEVRKSVENIKSTMTEDKVKKLIAANSKLKPAEVDEIYNNWNAKVNELSAQWDEKMDQLEANLEKTKQSVIEGADRVTNDFATALAIYFVLMVVGCATSVVAGLSGVNSSPLRRRI